MTGGLDSAAKNGASTDCQIPPYRWRVISASVAGSSHEKLGLPCQDAHKWAILESGALVAAVADGAGSAVLAEVGSTLAVQTAVEFVTMHDHLPTAADDDWAWISFLTTVLRSIQTAISKGAGDRGATESDLSTTVLVVMAIHELVAVAHVGDGAAVGMYRDGTIRALSIPQLGEYVNEAYFITMPGALENAQVTVHRGGITHLALMSDGLQMLALDTPGFVPHVPFFSPLFRFVTDSVDNADAQSQMSALLRSTRVRERTDDDLTLLLAGLVSDNDSV